MSNCEDCKNFEPKLTQKRHCCECKYAQFCLDEYPCSSCDIFGSRWERGKWVRVYKQKDAVKGGKCVQ